jgi:hypothetical protein
MSFLTKRCDEHADGQRRERCEIVQVDNEDAPTSIVFEAMALLCN